MLQIILLTAGQSETMSYGEQWQYSLFAILFYLIALLLVWLSIKWRWGWLVKLFIVLPIFIDIAFAWYVWYNSNQNIIILGLLKQIQYLWSEGLPFTLLIIKIFIFGSIVISMLLGRLFRLKKDNQEMKAKLKDLEKGNT